MVYRRYAVGQQVGERASSVADARAARSASSDSGVVTATSACSLQDRARQLRHLAAASRAPGRKPTCSLQSRPAGSGSSAGCWRRSASRSITVDAAGRHGEQAAVRQHAVADLHREIERAFRRSRRRRTRPAAAPSSPARSSERPIDRKRQPAKRYMLSCTRPEKPVIWRSSRPSARAVASPGRNARQLDAARSPQLVQRRPAIDREAVAHLARAGGRRRDGVEQVLRHAFGGIGAEESGIGGWRASSSGVSARPLSASRTCQARSRRIRPSARST